MPLVNILFWAVIILIVLLIIALYNLFEYSQLVDKITKENDDFRRKKMKIDFNNVRRQSVYSLNSLIIAIKEHFKKDIPDSIKTPLENLRSAVVGIACIYSEDDPECVCILDDNLGVESIEDEEE